MDRSANRVEVPVRFNEIDSMQIAHNSVYYVWFEVGRFRFASEVLRLRGEDLNNDILLPVVKSKCRYFDPVRFGDTLLVTTYMHVKKAAKIAFYYILENAGRVRKLHALGCTEHALIDGSGRLILRFPEHIKSMFTRAFEEERNFFLDDEQSGSWDDRLAR
jgi:acyl-CoA thioester hydrolase